MNEEILFYSFVLSFNPYYHKDIVRNLTLNGINGELEIFVNFTEYLELVVSKINGKRVSFYNIADNCSSPFIINNELDENTFNILFATSGFTVTFSEKPLFDNDIKLLDDLYAHFLPAPIFSIPTKNTVKVLKYSRNRKELKLSVYRGAFGFNVFDNLELLFIIEKSLDKLGNKRYFCVVEKYVYPHLKLLGFKEIYKYTATRTGHELRIMYLDNRKELK